MLFFILAPGPTRALALMETFGPILAVGCTVAEGWMYTGGTISGPSVEGGVRGVHGIADGD